MRTLNVIMNEISQVINKIQETEIDNAVSILESDKRIFVYGEGRSGYMGRSFAMRLMHLGFIAYFIGETISPSIKSGDIVVLISGSGKSTQTNQIAHQAKKIGCTIVVITAEKESELVELSTLTIILQTGTKFDKGNQKSSVQPLSSLFDQCTHIIVDAICLKVKNSQDIDEGILFSRHTNL